MENKVVYDVKESSLEIVIPGIAINGLAFENKREAEKFVQKYYSDNRVHVEDRVEKPVYTSVEDFEKSLKEKLEGYREQLKSIKLLETKFDKDVFEYDKAYIEYNICNIERFLKKAKISQIEEEKEM